ncbi:MAG: flagellar motor switch protein FliN [Armatimonadetes bacterium]|nr:flagellar motor switch protein FliN [Armatimonadota bacterium]
MPESPMPSEPQELRVTPAVSPEDAAETASEPAAEGESPARGLAAPPAAAAEAVARRVEFGQLTPRSPQPADRNINLLMDVMLEVTVELGRARMRIRDVLALGLGSVIELDRLAGESVDLYLNDRLFARGEVVVIEESFGVRITEILSPEARMQTLGTRPGANTAS